MAQHFLLSAKARTLSLAAVMRMTDEEAHAAFVAIRWAANGGQPVCPHCDCAAVYAYTTRRIWKCKACGHQFSVTSGTIWVPVIVAISCLLLSPVRRLRGSRRAVEIQGL